MDSLKIFYDGGCKVCAWEVKKYLAHDPERRLGTIDINATDFQAEKYGLDRKAVRKYFHVLTSSGAVVFGVDAFIEIWTTLDTPLSRRAAKFARNRFVHFLIDVGYRGFVEIRPLLPRNKIIRANCEDDACDIR